MKIKLVKKVRNIIIGLILFLALTCGVLIYTTINATENINNTIELYSYELKPTLDYNITMIYNPIYNNLNLGEEQTYIKKLLDYVTVNFGISYIGSDSYPIEIEYKIDATVTGQESTEPESIIKGVCWSKVFPLINNQIINTTSNSCEIQKSINFSVADYENFANEAINITGIKIPHYLTIAMTGSIKIDTPYEVISLPINLNIQLPLLKDTFTITKSNTNIVQDTITSSETTTLPKPYNRIFIIIYVSIILLSIITITLLIIFSIEPTRQDIVYKKIKHIIKNYNSRLIAVRFMDDIVIKQIYSVQCIDDLVKVADEIERPIYYLYDKNKINYDSKFYVQDKDDLYIYDVNIFYPNDELVEDTII